MNNIGQVFRNLKKTASKTNTEITLDSASDTFSFFYGNAQYTASVNKSGKPSLCIFCNNHEHFCGCSDFNMLYCLIKGILLDKVTVSSTDTTVDLDGKGLNLLMKNTAVKWFFAFILGLASFLFGAFLISGYIYGLVNNNDLEYAAMFPFCISCIILGIDLFFYSFTQARHRGNIILQFFGILITGFSLTLDGITWVEYYTDSIHEKLSDTIGATVLFMMMLSLGVVFIWLSFRAKPRDEEFHRLLFRKPILPSLRNTERLIEKLSEIHNTYEILIHRDTSRTPRFTDSRIGGIPYWDLSKPYPTAADGSKLTFVCQINLSELPDNDIFPKTGLLQFFVPYGETEVSGCHTIYHEKIDMFIDEKYVISHISSNKNADFNNYNEFDIEANDDHILFFLDRTQFAVTFSKSIIPFDLSAPDIMDHIRKTAEEMGISIERTLLPSELLTGYPQILNKYHGSSNDTKLLGSCSSVKTDFRYDRLLFQFNPATFVDYDYDYCGEYFESGLVYLINENRLLENKYSDTKISSFNDYEYDEGYYR